MSDLFEHILSAPGLFWISEYIFLDLIEDDKDFSNLELVGKTWLNYFVINELWKKRLHRKIAKNGSYQAIILQKHEKQFDDLADAHKYYRKFAFTFSTMAMKNAWHESRFNVNKISYCLIAAPRDLNEVDGSTLIFAQDNKVYVAQRTPFQWEKNKLGLHLKHDLIGHRREVTCLDIDKTSKIAIAGGKDRNLTLWDLSNGSLVNMKNDAHRRLITCVKLRNSNAFSSSRDRTVKVWNVPELQLLQVLHGYHGHSVWAIEIRNEFLVTASSDKSMNVWTNERSSIEQVWTLKHELKNNNIPLRNIIILKKSPTLAVAGDLGGDLKVWNLVTGLIEFEVPDPRRESPFPGAVVSLSQSLDFFAAGYVTNEVTLFDSSTYSSIITIGIDQYVDKNSFIRSIFLCDGQLYVCNVSAKVGILIFSIWE